ncbi:hypothetical protein LEMLEM_LOCUS16453 [Lemmus lemmus]
MLPASTVPPAPGSGRQLPRRPPLHQSPTSAPGRGHARLPPAPASPLPVPAGKLGKRRQGRGSVAELAPGLTSSPLRPPPDEPPGFFPCILPPPPLPPLPLSRSPRVSWPLPGGGARREAACCPRPGPAAAAPVLPRLERLKAPLLGAAAALAPFLLLLLLLLLRPPLAASSNSGCANHRDSSRRPPLPPLRLPQTPAAAFTGSPWPAGLACLHP